MRYPFRFAPFGVRALATILFFLTSFVVSAQAGSWKTFKHPAGIQFDYPGDWLLKEDESGIYVIPQPVQFNPQGIPEEFLLFQSVAAEGITDPKDPRVAEFFDQIWTANFPGMKRTGQPNAFTTKLGAATVMTFQGKLPAGVTHKHVVFLTIHQDQGIYMIHLAPQDSKRGLENTARKVFASLAATPPSIDSALLRSWSRSTTEGSVGLGASVFSNSTVTWTFKPDGTVLYSSQTRVDGNTAGLGVNAHSEGGPNVSTGRYSAANGQLFIYWEGGATERYTYKVFLDHEGTPSLKLVLFGEKKAKYYQ
ncbi:hypothetical protein [Nitrospina gracilis]|uniref:hypothetical protein n=1 Tax=Nitrospina gracilis TaxID=35801 RepID=UPI001F3186C1|nr:hypothetical protein [Nitrospina gracilis]MCF8719836.1 hypothetical protein [Nitrospina gracilis Nb-211]